MSLQRISQSKDKISLSFQVFTTLLNRFKMFKMFKIFSPLNLIVNRCMGITQGAFPMFSATGSLKVYFSSEDEHEMVVHFYH